MNKYSFPPIFRAKKVNIKSPILKCKLISFELKLNIKADIMFLQKKICSKLQSPIFPFKEEKSASKADHQLYLNIAKDCFIDLTQERTVSFYH